MVPTLFCLPPSRFLFALVFLDLLAVTLGLGLSRVLYGYWGAYTGGGSPEMWLSFAHLLVTGGLAGIVFRLRGCPPLRGWRDPRWVWLLIAVGFLYLAIDEATELHERLGLLISRIFGLQPITLTLTRIDGTILLGYGVLGVMVCYAYRTELAAHREVLPLAACGVILFVFSVLMDVAFFRELGVPWDWTPYVNTAEEVLEIFAAAALLGAMYTCAFSTARQTRTAGGAGRAAPDVRS